MNIIELKAGENTAESARLAGIATAAATTATTEADRSELAAQTTVAASRYFTSQALGEAGSTTGQLFSYDDGAGNLIFRKKTAGGSTEVARAVTPATLTGYVRKATNGGRVGLTDQATAIASPEAFVDVRNQGSVTNTFRVESRWTGTTASPFQNNDTVLLNTFTTVSSSGLNKSWSLSAPHYIKIPAGVTDSGERTGGFFWSTADADANHELDGTLATLRTVWAKAGFGQGHTGTITEVAGVRGEIVNESSGATIGSGVAVEGVAVPTHGTNTAVYAFRGTASNTGAGEAWFMHGDLGKSFLQDQLLLGAKYTDGVSHMAIRKAGNAHEFGFPDAGYGSNTGATVSSGFPFVAFCAEANATGDTFRTRGKKGVVILSDLLGAMVFARVPNASASNQAAIEAMRIDNTGRVQFADAPNAPSYSVGGLQVVGPQGAAVADATDAASAITQLNLVLARLRAHGLIA